MESIAVLQAVVTADTTDFERAMNRVQTGAQTTSGFLGSMGDFGQKLTMGLTLPLVGAGIAIAKVGSDFDAEMRNINSLLQLNEGALRGFGDEVNKVASGTIYGANQTADALYNIVSAGIGIQDTSDAMMLLGVSTKVAASGRDELDRTTMAMISLHENFGKVYSDIQIGDNLANMVQKGAGPLSSYTQNIAKVAPSAVALGVSLEELGSDVAQLSLTSGSGSKSMTQMSGAMTNLLRPNKTLLAAFKALGVETGQELVQKFGGLNEALFALQDVTDEVDFNKIFSKTGSEAVHLLTNDIDLTRKTYEDYKSSINGATERAFVEQMKSFDAAFTKAKSAIEGVAVVLSRTLLPILTPVFDGFSSIANAFINADPAMQSAVVIFGLIAAAAGPVIWAVASILATLNPLTVGIGLLAGAVSSNFGGIRDKIVSAADAAWKALKPLADVLENLIKLTSYKFDPVKITDFVGPLPAGDLSDYVFGAQTLADPMSIIKVDKPSSLWDIYKKQGYDKQFSWKEFMKKATEGGWKGGAIKPEDVINFGDGKGLTGPASAAATKALGIVKGAFGNIFKEGSRSSMFEGNSGFTMKGLGLDPEGALQTELMQSLAHLWENVSAVIPGMLQGVSSAIGGAVGFMGKAVVDLFSGIWDFFTNGGAALAPADILGFVDTNIIQPFVTAFGAAWPNMLISLGDLWNKVRGWFDEKIGAGIDLISNLFSVTSNTGGQTNIYRAVIDLLMGDIFKAIDDVIPGAGTHLKDLIGGDWGAKIGGAFPKISDALAGLAKNFGDWFLNDALPTISRSIGFFMGRVGGLLAGGFKDLISGIGKGPGVDTGGAVKALGDEIFTPFSSGLQEGMASTGKVDMTDTFKGFADQLVAGLAGAIGLASLASGAWGLASGGIWAGIQGLLVIPMSFAGSMLSVAGQIASTLATAVATQLGFAATWSGFAGAIASGVGALGLFAVNMGMAALSVVGSLMGSIVAAVGATSAWTGLAGAISVGIQTIGVVALTIADFAGTVAGAIAAPILAQLGITATWSTITSVIASGLGTVAVAASLALSTATSWAAAIAAPIMAQLGLMAAWTGIPAALAAGFSAIAVPALAAVATATGWATAIVTPIVTAIGASGAWLALAPMMWTVAAPIIAIGLAIAGVVAAVSHFNDVTAEGKKKAQITVEQEIVTRNLTEKEVEDQVFLSIQHSPLGDIGARLFYTNMKAQIVGDAVFKVNEITVDQGSLVDPMKQMLLGNAPLVVDVPVSFTYTQDYVVPDSNTDNLTKGTGTIIGASSFIDPNTPADVKMIGDEAVKNITETTAQFGQAVTDQIANGTLDPATVNDNFLVPLGTFWDAAFGPAGTLTTTTLAFAATVTKGFTDIGAALTTLVTNTPIELTLFTGAFILSEGVLAATMGLLASTTATSLTTFKNTFQSIMMQVGIYITNTVNKIVDLITQVNNLKDMSNTGNSGGSGAGGAWVDGSHANGLDNVPYDGYVAELHKGEAVLTAEQATSFRTPQTSISNSRTSTSTSSTAVTVNVYGGDTDKILAELKRRGIKIG